MSKVKKLLSKTKADYELFKTKVDIADVLWLIVLSAFLLGVSVGLLFR